MNSFDLLQDQTIGETGDDNFSYERRIPDVIFSSSGGNVASYICHGSNWNRTRILSNISKIDSTSYSTKWTSLLPSWIFIPFTKAIYRNGYGFGNLFKNIFASSENIKTKTEIWTGMYEIKSNQHKLITNKKKGETIINPTYHLDDIYLGDNSEPMYANGEINLLSKSTLASASVPWLINPIEIEEKEYSDGGLVAGSPLTTLKNDLVKYIKETGKRLKLTYISSSCISNLVLSSSLDIITDLAVLIRSVIHSDIREMISIMQILGASVTPTHSFQKITIEKYANLIKELENTVEHYCILLYPSDISNFVDFTSASSKEILIGVLNAEKDINLIVWSI